MPYSAQNVFENATAAVQSDKDKPELTPDSKQQCLEFFYDDLQTPKYVWIDGELIRNPEITNWFGILQIIGDDGALFIKIGSQIVLNRVQNWTIPEIVSNAIEQDFSALESTLIQL